MVAQQANNVSGSPTFATGETYFQTHANTAPEAGCTFSACTPFTGAGYGPSYVSCEHATSSWKSLTATANTTSNAARANANVPCTACPSS
ncbi:hypothetical protein CVIRNUC_008798 [Coccomyxa viridis]|uniref:Uncharacterized protein n=1 Tax=Coccomyxa viridis TaxID=1274662 RepID=A0AAV1IE65_9CHLO|nr:hypothetical protein CVIRNUC_008798 [Coccomyxa viridis]